MYNCSIFAVQKTTMSNSLKYTTMKKFYTLLAMAMMTMLTMTSCDADLEDRMEARTLEGTWTGYIDNYYYDRWGLTGNTYRTAFYFERENAYGGWGYEVDYDARRPSDYWYCDFRWEIVRGNIRIQYYDRDYTDVVIYDYMLDDYPATAGHTSHSTTIACSTGTTGRAARLAQPVTQNTTLQAQAASLNSRSLYIKEKEGQRPLFSLYSQPSFIGGIDSFRLQDA